MNMMNKCAKFHKDSQSDKKVKFNLPSAIELSETAVFVYNFVQVETHFWCKWATSVVPLTNFSFEFFIEIFTADASLHFLYHGAKKSFCENDQKLKTRGSCLKSALVRFFLIANTPTWRVCCIHDPAGQVSHFSGTSSGIYCLTWSSLNLFCLKLAFKLSKGGRVVPRTIISTNLSPTADIVCIRQKTTALCLWRAREETIR